MQCTGTSELQPSLDRARSASTNCLRPDTSLHSPEQERYKTKTSQFLVICAGGLYPFVSFSISIIVACIVHSCFDICRHFIYRCHAYCALMLLITTLDFLTSLSHFLSLSLFPFLF